MVNTKMETEKATPTLLREWQRDDDSVTRMMDDDSSSSSGGAASPLATPPPASPQSDIAAEERQHLLEQAQQGEDLLSSRRPDRISLTTVVAHDACVAAATATTTCTTTLDDVGVTFRYDAETKSIRLKSLQGLLFLEENSCCNATSVPLQVGDILESINEFSCQGLASLEELETNLGKQRSANSMITYNFLTKPVKEVSPVLLCQAITMIPRNDNNNEKPSTSTHGITFGTTKDGLLQIHKQAASGTLKANPWFTKFSAIQPGHIVVAIGKHGESTLHLDPSDAQLLLDALIVASSSSPSSPPSQLITISISTIAPAASCWQQRLRRTTVAVGGGTLVGMGAVVMASPFHPIGHAMTLGGLGLLGTEFEGPKRVLKKCFSLTKREKLQCQ